MTKTFTTTKGEYLLVEVNLWRRDKFIVLREWVFFGEWQLYQSNIDSVVEYLPCRCEIISLLKDITEEQAKEIVGSYEDHGPYLNHNNLFSSDPEKCFVLTATEELKTMLQSNRIDTSLNWLLLKKL